MSYLLGRILAGVACVALFHYLSILKTLSNDNVSLPRSLVVEVIGALGLFLVGTALGTAELKDVTFRGELARRDTEDYDPQMAFTILSPRAKPLFQNSPHPFIETR
ncbi:hypothetical protein M231_06100 [Tremella mesenterica]|uniref:Membrane magnesium transporter n=1 Tax=Tremella mesenterica TaxID=5217 RepID=A0A4Q1BE48_TREME|nr:hypothetical protein M231_06100 [Tremella mesenterica]